MPNHCHNDLYIRGSEKDVTDVLALIGADRDPPEFDFNAVIPYPERFAQMDSEAKGFGWNAPAGMSKEEMQAARDAYVAKWGTESDGFNSGGYEWCVENWGTKWGAYDVARRDYQGACFTYQTAWGPSRQIVQALASRFPTVTFILEYFERGMAFCGGFECPRQDDYYAEDEGGKPWHAGIVVNEWEAKGYRGHRGG